MTEYFFIGDRLLLEVSFRAAQARLRTLVGNGVLLGASQVAYDQGITDLVEAEGSAAGLSRLAGIRLEDKPTMNECSRTALRWEAIASDGGLFAVLSADLMLIPCQGPGKVVN